MIRSASQTQRHNNKHKSILPCFIPVLIREDRTTFCLNAPEELHEIKPQDFSEKICFLYGDEIM